MAVLTGRTVREELNLPPPYFSSHSLRKDGITHMCAQGSTEEDRSDRGNYAAGSQVMNNTYDYATGLGPLASNSLEGGHKLNKSDLQRLLTLQGRRTHRTQVSGASRTGGAASLGDGWVKGRA